MGKIGRYPYPDLELSKAIIIADKIKKDFGGKISAGNLARLFGIEPRGGGFANRVGDLVDYGLLEGAREYKLTRLALKILENPTDRGARAEAFLRVDLFKAMNSEFHGDVPEDNNAFVLRMKDVVGEQDDKAVSIRAGRLRNHYNEALPYLYPERYPAIITMVSSDAGEGVSAPLSSAGPIDYGPQSQSGLLTVPPEYKTLVMPETFIVATKNDLESVNLLEDQFRTWIKHLRAKLTAKGP